LTIESISYASLPIVKFILLAFSSLCSLEKMTVTANIIIIIISAGRALLQIEDINQGPQHQQAAARSRVE
jgi:hypothetical protein